MACILDYPVSVIVWLGHYLVTPLPQLEIVSDLTIEAYHSTNQYCLPLLLSQGELHDTLVKCYSVLFCAPAEYYSRASESPTSVGI